MTGAGSHTKPRRIDQALHVLAPHDAIGNHVLMLRDVLRELGYESDIWVGRAHPDVEHHARPIAEMPAETMPGTWVLFHHSTGSVVTPIILARHEPLVVDYHNVTPPELVGRWFPDVIDELELGVEQVASVAKSSFFGVAHSTFSAGELERAGCPATAIIAPFVDPALVDRVAPDRATLDALRAQKTGADWLFVGRISPHKAQHDLVKALCAYREQVDAGARLHLIGSGLGIDYPRALERFCARLGMQEAVRVTSGVSPAVLAAYYRACDVFVCASDHEGFCVPIVEAMASGLPVVAYAAAAVGETVGSGGLVLDDKSPLTIASAVGDVVGRPDVRARLVAAGRRRAEALARPALQQAWAETLQRAVTLAPQP